MLACKSWVVFCASPLKRIEDLVPPDENTPLNRTYSALQKCAKIRSFN